MYIFCQSADFCDSVAHLFPACVFVKILVLILAHFSEVWQWYKKGSVFISLIPDKIMGCVCECWCQWWVLGCCRWFDWQSSMRCKSALSFSSIYLRYIAFWTLCSVNSFNNFCRQKDRVTTVFVQMEKKAACLKTSSEFSSWYFAVCLKNWELPSST